MSARLLIVLLSQQGYWFGGQEGAISVQWVLERDQPEAVLVWQVALGDLQLSGGQVALAKGDGAARLQMTLPEVRVRTLMQWRYQLLHRGDGRVLAKGEAALHVFPNDVLAGLAELAAGRRVVVWDTEGRLSDVLSEAGVAIRRLRAGSELQLTRADVILVAADEINTAAGSFSQVPLVGQAEAGAGVMIFAQPKAKVLAGYGLARRALPTTMRWRHEHPLLGRFGPGDLSSWLAGPPMTLPSVQLPADEPAYEIAYWPPEVAGDAPVAIDALLVTKTVGVGRIVLCQIPLGPWATDPRSQMLLANAVRYLLTRPVPMLPPSRRLSAASQPQREPAMILLPGGAS